MKKKLELLDKQIIYINYALSGEYQDIFFGGAVGFGKTYSQIILANELSNVYPGVRIIVLGSTLDSLKDNILYNYRKLYGFAEGIKWKVVDGSEIHVFTGKYEVYEFEGNEVKKELISIIYLRHFEASRAKSQAIKMQGLEVPIFIKDEETNMDPFAVEFMNNRLRTAEYGPHMTPYWDNARNYNVGEYVRWESDKWHIKCECIKDLDTQEKIIFNDDKIDFYWRCISATNEEPAVDSQSWIKVPSVLSVGAGNPNGISEPRLIRKYMKPTNEGEHDCLIDIYESYDEDGNPVGEFLETRKLAYIRAVTRENHFMNPTYLKQLYDQYPDKISRNAYLEGRWGNIGGLFFRNISELHFIEPFTIQPWFKVSIAIDYGAGSDDTVVLFMAFDPNIPNGKRYIYDAICFVNYRIPDPKLDNMTYLYEQVSPQKIVAQILQKFNNDWALLYSKVVQVIIPTDAKKTTGSHQKRNMDLFIELGLPVIEFNTPASARIDRWNLIKTWAEPYMDPMEKRMTSRIQIFTTPRLEGLKEQIYAAVEHPNKKGDLLLAMDDWLDAFAYLLVGHDNLPWVTNDDINKADNDIAQRKLIDKHKQHQKEYMIKISEALGLYEEIPRRKIRKGRREINDK